MIHVPTIFLSPWLPNKGSVCDSVFVRLFLPEVWLQLVALLMWTIFDHRRKYLVHVVLSPRAPLTSSRIHTHTHTHTAGVNYPTAAAEILDILELQMALLTGGRDRQGKSLITFPAKPKTFTYNRDDVRKVIQYLTSIPTYVVLSCV